MSVYEIAIDYTTGNSFNSERLTETVGCAWTDIAKAKAALDSIREHHTAVMKMEASESSWNRNADKFSIREVKTKYWYNPEYWTGSLYVLTDDDTNQRIDTFWIGYFEQLHSAKITISEDNDMEYIP